MNNLIFRKINDFNHPLPLLKKEGRQKALAEEHAPTPPTLIF